MRPIVGTITEIRPIRGEGEVAWRTYAEELEGRLSRLETGLAALRDHVDQTDAELLAEINRVEDKVGETSERVTLKVLADEARFRAYRTDI